MITYRGVAYYPEFWPEERWDEDIRLMKEAGINLVRIGEFAWIAMEPAEGRFTLDWLHRIVTKFSEAAIQVMLCTPTAAPPAWLTTQYPETMLVRKDGRRAAHGARRHYCPNNNVYQVHSQRITDRLSREFSGYANVVAWQLDNEFGPEMSFCYCDYCSSRFRAWLQRRYGSLDALNSAWQTRFWSVTFTEWQQVHLQMEKGYPSIEMDVRRFFSDSYIDFARHQTEIISANHPQAIVTTNMMGPIFPAINYYKLAQSLDVVSDDLYFDIATLDADALACDLFRCMAPGKPFWITETGSGALSTGKVPDPRQLRAWAFSALARGSEAHVFFRWRTCLAGQEQDLQGIIETNGKPARRYRAVQSLFAELEQLTPVLQDLPLPRADVAIILSYDSIWAYDTTVIGRSVQYISHIHSLHKLLYQRNVLVDIIPPDRDLSAYKVVILPSLCIIDDDLTGRVTEFVQNGGTVLATPQLASRDFNNNHVSYSAPGVLGELFGFEVACHTYLDSASEPDQALWVPKPNIVDETVVVRLTSGIDGSAERYMEDICLKGGMAGGHFAGNLFDGCPAIVQNRFGKGQTWYTAAYLDDHLMGEVLDQVLSQADVLMEKDTPPWVEIVRRGDVVFILNHRRQTVRVTVALGKVLIGTVVDNRAELAPFDVVVVREEEL